ncbi:flagellar biosynthetic protein FliQ [Aquamicrobium sp. LC103]|uniref:EscS/YscS/HrcS family type III secretion system export apparatus protein n=1 Tax=Aquamicrobium sp. LC103 TaxID=1120658 RepID=UPI00063E72DC|nr:flagellar biosynthetic protein FliQ [Aquamicrobium sp. LC103]TKT69259.1 flagellar biosynthetic protein FliQ [Aquamicrobium sp. LC103]
MSNDFILAQVQGSLLTVLFTSAPVIVAALVVGLLVGFGQALTQIQDQTLPQSIKLVVVLLVILFFGPLLGYQIAQHASAALDQFPVVTR